MEKGVKGGEKERTLRRWRRRGSRWRLEAVQVALENWMRQRGSHQFSFEYRGQFWI